MLAYILKKTAYHSKNHRDLWLKKVLMALLGRMGRTGERREAKRQRIEALCMGLINVDLKW